MNNDNKVVEKNFERKIEVRRKNNTRRDRQRKTKIKNYIYIINFAVAARRSLNVCLY